MRHSLAFPQETQTSHFLLLFDPPRQFYSLSVCLLTCFFISTQEQQRLRKKIRYRNSQQVYYSQYVKPPCNNYCGAPINRTALLIQTSHCLVCLGRHVRTVSVHKMVSADSNGKSCLQIQLLKAERKSQEKMGCRRGVLFAACKVEYKVSTNSGGHS